MWDYARVSPDSAVRYLRSLAAERLRAARANPRFMWADEDYELGGEPAEEEGEIRLRAAALALVLTDVLDKRTALEVVAESHATFAAHGLVRQRPQRIRREPPAVTQPRPALPPAGPAGTPAPDTTPAGSPKPPDCARRPPPGTFRAVRVGAAAPAELAGMDGTVHLLSLVLAPDRAALCIAFDPSGARPARIPGNAVFPGFLNAGAVDDRGRSYRLRFAGGPYGWWDGVLVFDPVPPPDTAYLDLPAGPGATVRADLTGPACTQVPVTEPAEPRTPGEVLLDAVTQGLCGGGPLAGITSLLLARSLPEVVAALEAGEVLPAGSPVTTHLAAICQARGMDIRGDLTARAGQALLPEHWGNLLANSHAQDGPRGVAPAAAILPEIDDARFTVTAVRSWDHEAVVTLLAWGQQEAFGERHTNWPPRSWWAFDDTGRWHIGRLHRELEPDRPHRFLTLQPPLHPQATSLTVILTGSERRAQVTMPLNWQPPTTRAPAPIGNSN